MLREFCLKQVITSVLFPVEKWLLFRSFGGVNMLENSDYLADSRLKDVRSATQRKVLKNKFVKAFKRVTVTFWKLEENLSTTRRHV